MKKISAIILACICTISFFSIDSKAALFMPRCLEMPAETGLGSITEMRESIGEIKVGDSEHLMSNLELLRATEGDVGIKEPSSTAWSGNVAEQFAGGNGSKENPYQIATAEQLAKLANDVSGHGIKYTGQYFVLTQSIVINENVSKKLGTSGERALKQWIPIGNETYAFEGIFNGNGYTVYGVYISNEDLQYAGLFGTVNGGVVGNLKVIDTYINAGNYTGGICGHMAYGAFIGCMHVGQIYGKDSTGGISGRVIDGFIYDCYNGGKVQSFGTSTGGICGYYAFRDIIDNPYGQFEIAGCINNAHIIGESRKVPDIYQGTVIGEKYSGGDSVGGICGNCTDYSTYEGVVYRCMNFGAIDGGGEQIGGIFGTGGSDVLSCANFGAIAGEDYIGGICGVTTGYIKNSYNVGNVKFKGHSFGSISPHNRDNINCYYLEDGYCEYSTEMTAEQFASGEVAYLLNESANCGNIWYQTIGVDPYPVLDSSHGAVRYDGSGYQNGHRTEWEPNADGVSHDGICVYCTRAVTNEKHSIDENYICSDCGYAVPVDKIRAFVERCYEKILERTGEETGVEFWLGELAFGRYTAAQAAASFVFSQEFVNQNNENEVFLDRLYAAFFDRMADASGKAFWLNYLENGVTREYVTAQFVNSAEFTEVCAEYGMQRGSIGLNGYVNVNPNLTMYVVRCYREIHEREADPDGLEFWCQMICTKERDATLVAKSFVDSPEFEGRNLSNEEYIKVLYRAFMGRESDPSGLAYWIGRLESGTPRLVVLDEFANCPEFWDILEGFGL